MRYIDPTWKIIQQFLSEPDNVQAGNEELAAGKGPLMEVEEKVDEMEEVKEVKEEEEPLVKATQGVVKQPGLLKE